MRIKLTCLLIFFATQSQAQTDKPPSPQKVIINGSQTDVENSRDFIAGKIVIGKQRIAESGVPNVGDLLRREPAISIGKDGRIGLLGLAGYTQVLVDGMPPQGDPFAIDLLTVERIEILKSTSAVTGPIGIAGTINIVRRKTERKASTQLRLGSSSTGGRPGANVSLSSNQIVSSSPFSYNVSLSASDKPAPGQSRYSETRGLGATRLNPDFDGEIYAPSELKTVLASTEVTWALNPSHKLSFRPDAGLFTFSQDSLEHRRWADGHSLFVHQQSDQPMRAYSLPLRWNWQIDADTSLAVKWNMNRTRLDSGSLRSEYWSDASRHLRENGEVRDMRGRFLDVDFNTELDNGHQITAGAKLVRNNSSNAYTDFTDGVPDLSSAVFGSESAARLDRKQLFAQDEWRIDRSLALNIGASVEQRTYDFHEGPVRSEAHFNMWSPSMHLSKKIKGNSKRQIRFSLARSFQPPGLDQMLLHPSVNPFAPCISDKLCSTNTIDTADSAGNPGLQPERALGLNLSYTHGIGAGSEVLLEFYSRDIQNKIGRELVLEDVAWASAPRYVYRPANFGQATVRGVNLEGRLSVKDIWNNSSNMELHGSAGLARSALSELPGPDNRIVEQTPWRAKIGGSYTMQAMPVKLGFDASLLPADWVRNNLSERIYQSSKFTLGANARWKLTADSSLTLNLDNLLPKTASRIDEYQSQAESLQRFTNVSNYSRVSLQLETKL
jgi:outer membrane receptor for ferrienterochelin and colicin